MKGQERINSAKVMIIGVGALGSVVAELLCRAGIRDITLCDYDIIEESNLQRQGLYTTGDLSRLKVEAAKEHLIAIDPLCLVATIAEPFSSQTDMRGYDLIIDGTDSLDARLLINDVARRSDIPLVIGTASGTRGMVFAVTGSPCWQCVMRGKSATDDCDSGVLGSATHAIASLQASVALRVLLGDAPKDLIEFDAWNMELRSILVERNHSCEACRGLYQHLSPGLRFCASATRALARAPRVLHLDKIKEGLQVEKDYGTAILIKLGEGTALIHQHGTIEFSGVDGAEAKRFAEKMLK
jgi:adenylyltransferase/sulfurtransferase